MKKISIVIPAYNESEVLPQLIHKVRNVMEEIHYCYEILLIDDGSNDNTFNVIKILSTEVSALHGIRLSCNVGHQAAICCGLEHATGDAVITMDADLQHPPELIKKMVKLWEDGDIDIVFTEKETTSGHGFFYKVFAKTFYLFFNRVSTIQLTYNGSDFRLLSRRAVDSLNRLQEYHKFYRGLVHLIGFNSTTISFKVEDRAGGTPSYTIRKSIKLAIDGILSFSEFGLRIPLFLGLFLLFIISVYFLYNLIGWFFGIVSFEPGWTSVMVLIVFSIALQLTFVGILGFYVGKVFMEVKRRPIYFISDTVGYSPNKSKNKVV